MKPAFLETPATTAVQACKLGMGRARTLVAEFETHQVISFYKGSFVVSIVACKSASTGLVLALEPLFDAAIEELQRVIRPE